MKINLVISRVRILEWQCFHYRWPR